MEIIDYPNYLIYENGKVYNKKYNRFLKPSLRNGYLSVSLYKDCKEKKMALHRLIALYYIPNPENKECVDHIDRITTNNNIENLRWVTHRENNCNRTDQNKYIGATKHGNKYQARIGVNGKEIYIGTYKTEEEAGEAYVEYRNNLIFKENAITINININMPSVKKTVAVEPVVEKTVEEPVPEIMVVIKTDEDEKHLAKLKKQKEYREKNKDVINEKRRAKRAEAKLKAV